MRLKNIVVCLIIFACSTAVFADQGLPNFGKIKDPVKRQQQFFNYLLPKALKADRKVLEQRQELLKLHAKFKAGEKLTPAELDWLKLLYQSYFSFDIHNEKAWQKIINRVDVVPVSMILGQADKETAAGTTRFAHDGNNLFGTWCYTPDCGLIPKRRPKGEHFEVAKYPNIETSIQRYIHNLNTNKAYKPFREMRTEMRKDHENPNGLTLVGGVLQYSAEHETYINDVRHIILKFNLTSLDGLINQKPFAEYKAMIKQQALQQGLPSALVNKEVSQIHLLPKTLQSALNQPEFHLKFNNYLDLYVTYQRMQEAKQQFTQNKKLLNAVAKQYQVDPSVIISLWAVETNFGEFTGNFPELSTLATLDYAGYRSHFFHPEVFAALKILAKHDATANDMRGSWAGAIGQTQFLPSRYLLYAVDFDHKGKKDVWHDKADVFASIAKYLAHNGWHYQQPVSEQVTLPKNLDSKLLGQSLKKSVSEWRRLGVKPTHAKSLGNPDWQTSIVAPAGVSGPIFMIYPNFSVIKKWNDSDYYALAVGTFMNRLKT